MRSVRTIRRRPAFTIVELLVAAGLSVLLMTVLTIAFQAGMESLSKLKSASSLAEQIRTAEIMLRNDLAAQHLEDASGEPIRISKQLVGTSPPPAKGFFRIVQHNPSTVEGSENGINSYRATDHILQMTVKLPARTSTEVFRTVFQNDVPSSLTDMPAALQGQNLVDFTSNPTSLYPDEYAGKWAIVTYFLDTRPIGQTVDPATGGPGINYYCLYRRIHVISSSSSATIPGVSLTPIASTPYYSTYPSLGWAGIGVDGNRTLLSADTVTDPRYRPGGISAARSDGEDIATGNLITGRPEDQIRPSGNGEDILLGNVISFQIQGLIDTGVLNYNWVDFPVSTTANLPGKRVFDTWGDPLRSAASPVVPVTNVALGSPPYAGRLRAIRINLRIYDPKRQTVRQTAIQTDL